MLRHEGLKGEPFDLRVSSLIAIDFHIFSQDLSRDVKLLYFIFNKRLRQEIVVIIHHLYFKYRYLERIHINNPHRV